MRDFGTCSALIVVMVYVGLILGVKGRYSCHLLSPFDLKFYLVDLPNVGISELAKEGDWYRSPLRNDRHEAEAS
jgi:hypothetical protein